MKITTRTMTARYSGKCRACSGWINAGEQIEYSRETGAVHAACPVKVQPAAEASKPSTYPGARASAPDKNLVPGVYENANGIFVVKPTREDKTRLYAKKMVQLNGDYRTTEAGTHVDFEFVYERGAIFSIKLTDRMTLERAKQLITLYGRCIACNRHLKAAKSVENGIGPVCIGYFGPVLNPTATTADGRTVKVAA